jgi:hypothetical protein
MKFLKLTQSAPGLKTNQQIVLPMMESSHLNGKITICFSDTAILLVIKQKSIKS